MRPTQLHYFSRAYHAAILRICDRRATLSKPAASNNTAGRLLGQGYAYGEVIAQMNQTAEGLSSVAPVLELAASKGVEMPICAAVAAILDGRMSVGDAIEGLLTRPFRAEG